MNRRNVVSALLAVGLAAGCGNDAAGPADGDRFRPVFNTLYSNVRDQARIVASDSASWAALWAAIASAVPDSPTRPAVNFKNEEVVIAAMGERRKAGFTVRIDQVVYTDSSRNVMVLQTLPAESCASAEVITTPLDAVVISRSTRPIRFVERVQIRTC